MQTLEADIDVNGIVQLREAVSLGSSRRALMTLLDEAPRPVVNEAALLSENALEDWNRPEQLS